MTCRLHHCWLAILLLLPCPLATAQTGFDAPAATQRMQSLIQTHYVMRDKVPALLAMLQQEQHRYARIRDPALFVKTVNVDLRRASNDYHVYLRLEPAVIEPVAGALEHPDQARQVRTRPPEDDVDNRERIERARETTSNHGLSRAEVLDGNIGYLRITEFTEPQHGLQTLAAAMHFLRNTRAMIIDVRGNPGGYGGLAETLASYWFDPEPILLTTVRFQSPQGKLLQTWSSSAVDGDRRVGTPLLILTDARTGSAAEWFAYTLQSTGKARTIGETTSGGANMNDYFEVAPGMRLSLSVGQPVSAATGTNWEGVGVKPDRAVAAGQALATAQGMLANAR